MAELWGAAVVTEQLSLLEGRRRRDAGIRLVQSNTDVDFATAVQQAIRLLVRAGRPFSSDAVRWLVDVEPHHDNAWGAQVQAAIRSGLIRRVGTVQSRRPKAHGRWIGLYEGASS